MPSSIEPFLEKAVVGERLTPEEGLRILESHDLTAIGQAADAVTRRLHPEPSMFRNMHFRLGPAERSGLELFRSLVAKLPDAELVESQILAE